MNGAEVAGQCGVADAFFDQALNAAFRLARLDGFRRLQVIETPPRVTVQYKKCGFLPFQRLETEEQGHVLGDVGKVTGVINVSVVHCDGHCASA